LLKSVLLRLEAVAPAHYVVLHTSPNLAAKFERRDIWTTLANDYHWHLEILPVVPSKAKSYALKEVYYNSLLPETAAQALRNVPA
jgi:UDPglucose--hexose-1-phosphate uridylyltransferase